MLTQKKYVGLVIKMANSFDVKVNKEDPIIWALVSKLAEMDLAGYDIGNVPASLELIVRDALGAKRKFFKAINYTIIDFSDLQNGSSFIQATTRLMVAGNDSQTAATGEGPIDALSGSLLKALETYYPVVKEFRLVDFSFKVLTENDGTSSPVRVVTTYVNSDDEKWRTVGVSKNFNRASWEAVVTAIIYGLIKNNEKEIADMKED